MSSESCPLCNAKVEEIRQLKSYFIKEKLSSYYKLDPDDLEINDYSILQCKNCSFEYASPSIEGSKSFYNWITAQNDYYPEERWEYSEIIKLIGREPFDLLDVGCGDGKFFDYVTKIGMDNSSFQGLDPTEGSVMICKSKGYTAFVGDTNSFTQKYPSKKFDYVVSFHCLEHIADPIKFISDLKLLLKENGSIFISTPYSPMDFELDWLDILNYPPHHLSRWNVRSYKELAKKIGLHISFFHPGLSLKSSIIQSFLFSNYGNKSQISKSELLLNIIKYPNKFAFHLTHQFKREKVNGRRASNVILVKLY